MSGLGCEVDSIEKGARDAGINIFWYPQAYETLPMTIVTPDIVNLG